MKQFLLLSLLLVLIGYPASAQVSYHSQKLKPTASAKEFVPSKVQRTFGPLLMGPEAPKPGTQLEKEELRKLKAQIKALPPRKAASAIETAPPPQVLDTFAGNSYNGSAPNDNSFAISSNGQLLSVVNTTVFAYDVNADSTLYQVSLAKFAEELTDAKNSKYDPRTLYDPEADRFIVVFLNGTTYQTSKVVIAFSKTGNVLDGFYLYALEGNPLENDTWSDYPHISIGKDDLFITMNTFYNGSTNNSGYVESTIRQIRKAEGYEGLPLVQSYYSNIEVNGKALFNFTGMAGGTGPYAAPFFFVSNRNLALENDSIFIVSILDKLSDHNNPVLTVKTVFAETSYGLPPDARQKNGHRFDCNDSRIQGGFYVNGKLQFVGNTVNSQGHSSFYHAIYDLRKEENTAYFTIIENDTMDFGYPNITYTGKSAFEDEAIITFNHTGPNTNSGFSALFFSNDYHYSEPIFLQEGSAYIDVLGFGSSQKYERWGDYTGSQPAYGETGVVWASGYNSGSNRRPATWIARLRSPSYMDKPIKANTNIKVSPNPSNDVFTMQFELDEPAELTFSLISMNGKLAAEQKLLTQDAYAGENTFAFKTTSLGAGIYYLLITDATGNILQEEKLVKY